MPQLIETIYPQHKVTFNAGPRIGKIEVYELDGVRTEVNFWYDCNGKLVKVS